MSEKKNNPQMLRPGLILILLVGGMLTLVIGQASSAHVRRFSDWSTPINLGPIVNSALNDSQPAISKDGRSLYFSSTRPGGLGNVDMYVSQRANRHEPWGSPINLGLPINTTSSEGNPALSRDGHFMFFQSTRPGGLGNIDIWVSWRKNKHDDFAWQPPVNLGPGVNSAASENGPSFFANDDDRACGAKAIRISGVAQLYFGSDRSGGFGASDIYVSEQMADGSFGPAVLVPQLNSGAIDQRPSIRRDGLEIFIHSDRPGSILSPTGVPSLDLWVATRASTLDAWSPPVNLGAINTSSLEQHPYLSSDSRTLFFTSDRAGGSGTPDLYMTTRERLGGKSDGECDDDDDN